MLHWEQAQFDRTAADIFGYHALQLGMPGIDALRENLHVGEVLPRASKAKRLIRLK